MPAVSTLGSSPIRVFISRDAAIIILGPAVETSMYVTIRVYNSPVSTNKFDVIMRHIY